MSARPLISIAVPCHNAASLLGWALASVVAQSVEDWECIVVDDGSEDRPGDVVSAFDDPRFRFISLENNVGRAGARQIALDAAKGVFLAKLDADDWLYPNKLACQVEVLQLMPEIALVSTGIAIEDESQRLIGVRARGPKNSCQSNQPLSGLTPPPMAHAPSMIRMEVAKRYRYNQCLARSEDADYLLKVLMENRYCMLYDVLYAYREYRSAAQSDTLEAYRSRMKMFWMARREYPVAAVRRTAETALKWALYRASFMTGQAGALVARRSATPTEDDVHEFETARSIVADVYSAMVDDRTLVGAVEDAM